MQNKEGFGLLKYSSLNIGDDIQSVAALRFLPKVDEYVHREYINTFKPHSCEKVKLIMNAWWLWNYKNFPPSKAIEPLMISMYIRSEKWKKFLSKKTREYFINHGPIGCRDMATKQWLESENIPAYFSGCLTLTLQRNPKIKRGDYILCIDAPEEIVECIKKRTNRPVYNLERMLSCSYTSIERIELAKLFLRLYHDAHCVVSPRLHAILPSLAFETPVLRLVVDEVKNDVRYQGYEDCVRAATVQEILSDEFFYDFENPPMNPDKHLQIRQQLIEKCSEFTGYNNKDSLLDEKINPFIEFFKLQSYKHEVIFDAAFRLKKFEIIKLFFMRLLKLVNPPRKSGNYKDY